MEGDAIQSETSPSMRSKTTNPELGENDGNTLRNAEKEQMSYSADATEDDPGQSMPQAELENTKNVSETEEDKLCVTLSSASVGKGDSVVTMNAENRDTAAEMGESQPQDANENNGITSGVEEKLTEGVSTLDSEVVETFTGEATETPTVSNVSHDPDEAVYDTATESETLNEETEEFSEDFDDTSDLAEYEMDMPSLRPREVPQAPRNFTSFIMDEHDDCELFIDFNKGGENFPSYPVSNSVRDQEFFDQDFQNVYQSTRETKALELPRETLIERILEMRERRNALLDQLTEREERDPRNILTKLNAELLELHEENRKLRNKLGPCKIHGKTSQRDLQQSEHSADSNSE